MGTEVRFTVANAAPWTCYSPGVDLSIAPNALVAYPQSAMTAVSAQKSSGVAYIYESTTAPRVHVYTTVDGTVHDYVASSNFPLPVRNYLYDIGIELYKPSQNTRSGNMESEFKVEISRF